MNAKWIAWDRMAWLSLVAGALLASCASMQVGSDYDRGASFVGYKTFAWMPRTNYGTLNPLVVQRARDSIRSVLGNRGFKFVDEPADADFVVDFTIGAHQRTDIRSYPVPYADPVLWTRHGWWGYRYWGDQVDVRQYREGVLSIDVFDGKTRRPVWHGWAKKELSSEDIAHSEGSIHTAVVAVLEKFPPP